MRFAKDLLPGCGGFSVVRFIIAGESGYDRSDRIEGHPECLVALNRFAEMVLEERCHVGEFGLCGLRLHALP